jgi:hypothetical protein
VFPHLGSTDVFSSYPLKAKYVKIIGKDKGYNSSLAYYQVKRWSKRAMKLSQSILERVLKMIWWRGRKWTHVKRFWGWDVFFLSKYWLPLFIYRDSWSFSFSSSFSILFLFLSLFSMLRPFEDLGILMINEEKNTLQKILFKWHGMIWLIHDYEDEGVVDISVVDAYSGVELCTLIFLGEARK